MPQPTKLLLGIALLLMVPIAFAQNNLGELLDGGAKKLSAEDFRQEVVERTLVGLDPNGTRLELMYARSGILKGAGGWYQGNTLYAGQFGAIDGVWNVDESGKICTSMMFGRTFLPLRCQSWFKYQDAYFVADSDSDRGAKVLRRTVKQ